MEKERAEDIHAMALGEPRLTAALYEVEESYFWKKFFGARITS